MFIRSILAATCIGALGACASITSDSMQTLRVETLDKDGKSVAGAACTLSNDRGVFNATTPATVSVRKSSEDLSIDCKKDGEPAVATGRLISRAGAGMFGNILIGGGIGAIIDHSKGVAYNYPDWVQLIFGEPQVFDRMHREDGKPTQSLAAIEKAKDGPTATAEVARNDAPAAAAPAAAGPAGQPGN